MRTISDYDTEAGARDEYGSGGPPTGFSDQGNGGAILNYMKRMAPLDCPANEGEIQPLSAIMCSIMMLNSVMERTGNRVLEEHGLTMPQWLALGCISHAGGEGISHSQIGQRLMLSKAPITGIVDRLERAGLVERKSDARDRRVSLALATPQGCETWWRVKNALRSATESICGTCLTSQEQEQLLELLSRMMSAFAAHDPSMPEFVPHGNSNEIPHGASPTKEAHS